MATYFSLRDGLITDTTTFGASISGAEKTTNTSAYTVTTSGDWSPILSGGSADVVDSIAVHLSSRSTNPTGVLSAQISQYGGILTKTGTALSVDTPFAGNQDGSIYFNGTSDYATIPASSDINLGTGDFTIEMWVKTTNTSLDTSGRSLFSFGTAAANKLALTLRTGTVGSATSTATTGSVSVYSSVYLIAGTINIADGNWNHVCLLRSGTSMILYVNGVQSGATATNSVNYNAGATTPMHLGAFTTSSGRFDGLISNFRVVVGAAIIPSPVPTNPLSAISNTTLLYQYPYINGYKNSIGYLNSLVGTYPISSFTSYGGPTSTTSYPLNWQLLKLSAPFLNSSRFFSLNLQTSDANQLTLMGVATSNIVDYNRMAVLSGIDSTESFLTKSNVTLSAASPFGAGVDGSMSFNGNGYARISRPMLLTGNFTLELWANFSALGANRVLVESYVDTLAGWQLYYRQSTTTSIAFWTSTNGVLLQDPSSSTITTNRWYHIAISRQSGTIKLFIDGIERASASNTTNHTSVGNFNIGAQYSTLTNYFAGCISNIRIINGIGIYTSNFTPATSPLNTYPPNYIAETRFHHNYPYDNNFYYNSYATDLHIGGYIDGYSTQNRIVTAGTLSADSIFVHNRGLLTFPTNSSSQINVLGFNGIQITGEGTLQIGASSTSIPKDITHQIVLSSNSIGVSNGGRLDVYGAYKIPYTRLTAPSNAGSVGYQVTDTVSGNWSVGDTIVFTPNTTIPSSYDDRTINAFQNVNAFSSTANTFAHTVLDYVPNIANLTRNVKIGGLSNTVKGSIDSLSGAIVNINNTEFRNINSYIISGKTASLSGCTLSGTGTENVLNSIDGYSTVFNGTNSNIASPNNNTDLNITAGTDFTFEVFVKSSNFAQNTRLFQFGNYPWTTSNFTTIGFGLDLQTTILAFNSIVGTTSNLISTPIANLIANEWNHVAVVGHNSRIKMYVNGILRAESAQVTWNYSSTFRINIGCQYDDIGFRLLYSGKLSNLRFVKGRAIYTSNFTPPTRSLTEITDTGVSTGILTLQDKIPVDKSYKNATLTLNNITTDQYDRPLFESNIVNTNISNNVFYKTQYGTLLDSVTSQNVTISNNLILSAKNAGFYLENVQGNLTQSGNIVVGPSPYGTFLKDTTLDIGGIVNYNNTNGMAISGIHVGNLDSMINTYSVSAGVYVDTTTSNLTSTTFSNITASNNRTVGFLVSGNSVNPLTPITLNINRLVANDNLSAGFEGYNISGNLSSLELNRNGFYGMKTSIGNAPTTIDGVTALMNNVSYVSAAIGILSATNYHPTVIKNANVGKSVAASTFGAAISLDSTKFSQFVVHNSTVSGGSSDFQLRTTRGQLEGSYLISNTNVGNLPVGAGITTSNYQPDVLKTTGFAFTNMNNASGYNVTYLAAGTRQIDSTVNISSETSPSERLTPKSTSIKLRSGSKFVALDAGQSTSIGVYIRKSTVASNGVAYNGTAPRLILKRNSYMGINSDIVMDQLDTTSENFLKLSGVTPAVTDSGVLEFYVDCDGTQGWINIDNWTGN